MRMRFSERKVSDPRYRTEAYNNAAIAGRKRFLVFYRNVSLLLRLCGCNWEDLNRKTSEYGLSLDGPNYAECIKRGSANGPRGTLYEFYCNHFGIELWRFFQPQEQFKEWAQYVITKGLYSLPDLGKPVAKFKSCSAGTLVYIFKSGLVHLGKRHNWRKVENLRLIPKGGVIVEHNKAENYIVVQADVVPTVPVEEKERLLAEIDRKIIKPTDGIRQVKPVVRGGGADQVKRRKL